MLRDKKNDLLPLLMMLEALEKIVVFSEGAEDAEAFYELNDQLNFNAILNLLVHVGETCGKLSDDLLTSTPEIEWKKIRGLRNRIAHDYPGLDTFAVFEVVKNEIPALIEQLYPVIVLRVSDGILDREELNAANGNRYYRHINFSILLGE
ncbi:DUF86 domain-containing protein [Candidatus Hydrogenedentota bacterium]